MSLLILAYHLLRPIASRRARLPRAALVVSFVLARNNLLGLLSGTFSRSFRVFSAVACSHLLYVLFALGVREGGVRKAARPTRLFSSTQRSFAVVALRV